MTTERLLVALWRMVAGGLATAEEGRAVLWVWRGEVEDTDPAAAYLRRAGYRMAAWR